MDQKRFLDEIIDKIVVVTKDKQKQQVDIRFKSSYVGDGFEWNEKGKLKKGYKISNSNFIRLLLNDRRSNEFTKEKLQFVLLRLRHRAVINETRQFLKLSKYYLK